VIFNSRKQSAGTLFYCAVTEKMMSAMRTDEKYKPRLSGQVNVSDRLEVEYWARKLGVGRDELRWAVQTAGPRCTAVEAALKGIRR